MKKIKFSILSIVMLILGYQNANAQTGCEQSSQCGFETKCVPFSFSSAGGGGECPFEICIEQQVNCGTPKMPCYSNAPVCSIINYNSSPPDNFCYVAPVLFTLCNCEIITTTIKIRRLYNNPNNNPYATIFLTGDNAANFIQFINGNGGTNYTIKGTLNTCNGAFVTHALFFNYNNGAVNYTIGLSVGL